MLVPVNNVYIRDSGNQAVNINPPNGLDFHITSHGSDWYWALFSLFGVCTLGMLGWALFGKKPRQHLFQYLSICALFVMSFQYFTIASNLGWTGIQAEFNHVTTSDQSVDPGIRQIFYARWVGYFLAFPALLFNWAALVGLSWSAALFTIGAQEVMVISFLVASLIHSTYKWGYYTFGVVAILLVILNLWKEYLPAAHEVDNTEGTKLKFHMLVINTCATVLFVLYPISFALSEGGNVIQPDSETIFYGILDVCLFIFVGAYFHYAVGTVDLEKRNFSKFDRKVFVNPSPFAYSQDPRNVAQQQQLQQPNTEVPSGLQNTANYQPNPEKIVSPVQTQEPVLNRNSALSASLSHETAHENAAAHV